MAIYRRMFVVENVATIHRLFEETIIDLEREDRALRAAGLPGVTTALDGLKRAHGEFGKGLDQVARRGAVTASTRIKEILGQTAKRDDTRISPHIRDRIVSRPLGQIAGYSTGAVGIADEAVLDRGGGWYWRVQEFGSGTPEVKSITTAATGRILRGYFYDAGMRNPVAPDATLFGAHPLFRPGPPIQGEPYRVGIVRREVEGRHFIKKGADAAEAEWRRNVAALQRATVTSLRGVAKAAAPIRRRP